MPNKYYRIKYILAREERTGKIRQHLSTTLTWSRMFYRVEPVGQDETLAYGDWKTMDGDMKNFSIYYMILFRSAFGVKTQKRQTQRFLPSLNHDLAVY
jgi:hypothetical protein